MKALDGTGASQDTTVPPSAWLPFCLQLLPLFCHHQTPAPNCTRNNAQTRRSKPNGASQWFLRLQIAVTKHSLSPRSKSQSLIMVPSLALHYFSFLSNSLYWLRTTGSGFLGTSLSRFSCNFFCSSALLPSLHFPSSLPFPSIHFSSALRLSGCYQEVRSGKPLDLVLPAAGRGVTARMSKWG